MPAIDFSQGSQPIRRYDVIGQHAPGVNRFVKHVALSNTELGSVHHDQEVEVVHMGPPLDRAGKIKAQVSGTVPLTNEEIKEIEAWIAGIADEYKRESSGLLQQYWIHPPWKDELDPNTQVRRYRRYSCAGFVLDGYRQVDIELLQISEEALPEVNQETIVKAYGVAPRLFQRFGIVGQGPWRIVLAGYVLHAMDRSPQEIRQQAYQAQTGDEQF